MQEALKKKKKQPTWQEGYNPKSKSNKELAPAEVSENIRAPKGQQGLLK